LRLFVNGQSIFSSDPSWSATDAWTFFAVTYDGTVAADNVKFYVGDIISSMTLTLSSTQSISADAVVNNAASRLYINRNDRSLHEYLDNMRVYGSKSDNSGALSENLLQDLLRWDTLELA
jgi:hypothetical protein